MLSLALNNLQNFTAMIRFAAEFKPVSVYNALI